MAPRYWPPPAEAARLPTAVSNGLNCDPAISGPLDVVKELLENALDAGATRLTVYARGAGMDMLGAMDNGCGLPATGEGLEDLCSRHTTSKLRDARDLPSLHSYGFRGSALSELSTWGRLRVYSRSVHAPGGCRGEGKGPPLAGLPDRLRAGIPAETPAARPRTPRGQPSTPRAAATSAAMSALLSSASRLARTAGAGTPRNPSTPTAPVGRVPPRANNTGAGREEPCTPTVPNAGERPPACHRLPVLSAEYENGELGRLVELDEETCALVLSQTTGEQEDLSSPFSLLLLTELRFNPEACADLFKRISELLGLYSLAHPDKHFRLFDCDTRHQVIAFPPGVRLKPALFRLFPYTERRERELRRLVHLGAAFALRRSSSGDPGQDFGILDESAYVGPPGVLDPHARAGKAINLSLFLPGAKRGTPRAASIRYSGRESPTAWYDFYASDEKPRGARAGSAEKGRGEGPSPSKAEAEVSAAAAVQEARNISSTLELAPRFQAASGKEALCWNLREVSAQELQLALAVAAKNKAARFSQARVDVVLSCLVEQADGPKKDPANPVDLRPGEQAFLAFFNGRPVDWKSLRDAAGEVFAPGYFPPFVYVEVAQPGLYGTADQSPRKDRLSLLYEEALQEAVLSLLQRYAASRGIQRERAEALPLTQREMCSGLDDGRVRKLGLPSDLRQEIAPQAGAHAGSPEKRFSVWFRETLEYMSGGEERKWALDPPDGGGASVAAAERAALELAPAGDKWIVVPAPEELRDVQEECIREAVREYERGFPAGAEEAARFVLERRAELEAQAEGDAGEDTRFLTPEFAAVHEVVSGRPLAVEAGRRSRSSMPGEAIERGRRGPAKSWAGQDRGQGTPSRERGSQSSRRSHLSSMSEGLASILSRPEDPSLEYIGLVQESELRYRFHFQAGENWERLDAVEELGEAFAAVLRGIVIECAQGTEPRRPAPPGAARSLQDAWAELGDSWGQERSARPARRPRPEPYGFDLRGAMLVRSGREAPLFDLGEAGPTLRAWLATMGTSSRVVVHPLFPLLQGEARKLARVLFSTSRMALPSGAEMAAFLRAQRRVWGPAPAPAPDNPLLARPVPPARGFLGQFAALLAGALVRCLAGAGERELGRAVFEAVSAGLTEERVLGLGGGP